MTNLVTRGIGLGNKALLVTAGLGLAPLPVTPTGGAFYAEPDRRLEKRIRELEFEAELIQEQVTDHIAAGEHAKPPEKRKEPKFSVKAAKRLDRHDTSLLLSELKTVQAKIKSAKSQLREIAQEEDDMDVLLLLQ